MKLFPALSVAVILCGTFTAAQAGIVEFKAPGPTSDVTIRLADETIRLSTYIGFPSHEGYNFAMLEDGAVTVTLDLGSGPESFTVIDRFATATGTYLTYGVVQYRSTCPVGTLGCYSLPIAQSLGNRAALNLVLESADASTHLQIKWEEYNPPGADTQTLYISQLTSTGAVNLFTRILGAGEYQLVLSYADAAPNSAPVANAGPDQRVNQVGTRVYLDSSNTYDDDGQELNYTWHLVSKPAGSAGNYDPPGLEYNSDDDWASFVPDIHGDYVLGLYVYDSHLRGSDVIDQVTYTFANAKPVAIAGDNQSVLNGDTVLLNGTASDADGNALTVLWTITQKPAGSLATVAEPTQLNTQFVADLPGLYEVSLVANDGWLASDPSVVQIVAVTFQSRIIDTLNEAIAELNALPVEVLKSTSARDRLTGKIVAAIAEIDAGNNSRAISILSHNVLTSINGCAVDGEPAKNDIVQDCAAQGTIYPLIATAIDMLNSLN